MYRWSLHLLQRIDANFDFATLVEFVHLITEKMPAEPATGEPSRLQVSRYQDSTGGLPLSPVDPDARWRRPRSYRPAILGYKEHVIVDKSGFILARQVTPADVGDAEGAEALLDRLPIVPRSLTGDSSYGAGYFRQVVRRRGIILYSPLKETQETTAGTLLALGAFRYHGDHLVCQTDKLLDQTGFPGADGA